MQVQAIALTPGLMHQLGQLSALQGLDVHSFEGSISGCASYLQPPLLPPLTPLFHCKQLRWLDISHWIVKPAEVSTLAAHYFTVLYYMSKLQHSLRCYLGLAV